MRHHALALALIAGVVVGGCGGGGSSTPSSPSSTAPGTITIVGQNGTQAFTPNPSSFGGQMVVFRNNDSIPHRVVLNDASIDTGNIAPGATSSAVFMPASGTNYHCQLHPGMIGAVNGSGGSPPACTGQYCDAY